MCYLLDGAPTGRKQGEASFVVETKGLILSLCAEVLLQCLCVITQLSATNLCDFHSGL